MKKHDLAGRHCAT